MDIELLSDEALMKRVCDRDRHAFQVLFCRYEVRIYNFVLRCVGSSPLAEDLLQETFWRVWQAAGTFQPTKGGFRTWVYRVALNVARTELVRKRHLLEVSDQAAGEGTIPVLLSGDNPAESLERKEEAELVSRALGGLSPALREIVVLRCVGGMKFSEIASVTGAPEGTLKSRFHRAVAELRRRLLPEER